jgi:hypothetical protein
VRKGTIAKARSDFGFDPINDLSVQRHIIVRKIDISRLRDQGKPKKQKEDSEVHVGEITSNGFHGKALVCGSDNDHEQELGHYRAFVAKRARQRRRASITCQQISPGIPIASSRTRAINARVMAR